MRTRGFTLIELIVATTILAILTMMALPLARVTIQRQKEKELRRALWEMRDAIDRYKDDAGRGAFQTKGGANAGPTATIGHPQQYKPAPSSYLSKYGAQLACEASVGVALVSDQQEQIFGAAFGLLAGYYKGNVIAATGGLILAANVTVGNALKARSICVPLAWGPGYF